MSGYVDAAPVREHVVALLASGFLRRGVAESACVSPTVITKLCRGQRWMQAPTAERLMSVTPVCALDRADPKGFVLGVGARRRIRALLARGWRHQDIAEWVPSSAAILNEPGEWVTQMNHDRVCAAYKALSDRDGPSSQTRARAKRFGYDDPWAWDDDTIDDPKAGPWRPAPVEVPADQLAELEADSDLDVRSRNSRLGVLKLKQITAARHAYLIGEVEFLMQAHTHPLMIAQQLGLSATATEVVLRRAGRPDLALPFGRILLEEATRSKNRRGVAA